MKTKNIPFAVALVFMAAATACKSPAPAVTHAVTERIRTDTLRQTVRDTLRLYVRDSIVTDTAGRVISRDRLVWRDRLTRDTVQVLHRDTLRDTVTLTATPQGKRDSLLTRLWAAVRGILAACGGIAVILCALRLRRKYF